MTEMRCDASMLCIVDAATQLFKQNTMCPFGRNTFSKFREGGVWIVEVDVDNLLVECMERSLIR